MRWKTLPGCKPRDRIQTMLDEEDFEDIKVADWTQQSTITRNS